MRPQGEVYKAQSSQEQGELRVALSPEEKQRYKKLRLIGAILASLSLTSLIFFYGPTFLLDLDFVSRLDDRKIAAITKETPQLEAETKVAAVEEPTSTPEPVVQEFRINIPAIEAESQVIGEIDPFDEDEYLSALKKGVAHAQGTAFPGGGRRIYLFAHSTNSPLNFAEFNAVFYQLRRLSEGDQIQVDYNGQKYVYEVSGKHIVSAADTTWLVDPGEEEDLVLQTCDPPGTTLRRLLVVAKPVKA